MLRNIGLAALLIGAGTLVQPANADDDDKILTIGDKAPKLDIDHWVKGESFDSFEKGKVYVVEFWATWCGPCIRNMPHLSELQERYRDYDVTIVGISGEKKLQTVVNFLAKQDDEGRTWYNKLDYTVASDPDRSVNNKYMKPAGRTGIPCAFIVGKDSHIDWIGHPARMDDALRAIVNDEWDRDAFKAEFLPQQRATIERNKLRGAMSAARKAGDFEKINALLDQTLANSPNDPTTLSEKFTVLLTNLNRSDDAYAVGRKLMKIAWKEAQTLNMLAWTVVDPARKVQSRDLEFALEAANQAADLTEHKEAAILDTLARVHFELGHLEKAIQIQRDAVSHAEGRMKDDLTKVLEEYEIARRDR